MKRRRPSSPDVEPDSAPPEEEEEEEVAEALVVIDISNDTPEDAPEDDTPNTPDFPQNVFLCAPGSLKMLCGLCMAEKAPSAGSGAEEEKEHLKPGERRWTPSGLRVAEKNSVGPKQSSPKKQRRNSTEPVQNSTETNLFISGIVQHMFLNLSLTNST